nr:hypothetical protein [Stackebrandtia nassauensis]
MTPTGGGSRQPTESVRRSRQVVRIGVVFIEELDDVEPALVDVEVDVALRPSVDLQHRAADYRFGERPL